MKTLFGKVKKEKEAKGKGPEPSHGGKKIEAEAPARYLQDGERITFPGRVVPLWRPPEPDPDLPTGEDILSFGKLPLDEITGEAFGEVLQGRKNKDGVRFVGFRVRLQMKDDSILSGWLPEADFMKYRGEAIARGWRSAGRRR